LKVFDAVLFPIISLFQLRWYFFHSRGYCDYNYHSLIFTLKRFICCATVLIFIADEHQSTAGVLVFDLGAVDERLVGVRRAAMA